MLKFCFFQKNFQYNIYNSILKHFKFNQLHKSSCYYYQKFSQINEKKQYKSALKDEKQINEKQNSNRLTTSIDNHKQYIELRNNFILASKNRKNYEQYLEPLKAYIPQLQIKDLKQILFATCQVNLKDEHFLSLIFQNFSTNKQFLKSIEFDYLGYIAYSLGKHSENITIKQNRQIMIEIGQTLIENVANNISDLSPKHVTFYLQMMNKLYIFDQLFLDKLMLQIKKNISNFNQQDISQTIFNLVKIYAHQEKNLQDQQNLQNLYIKIKEFIFSPEVTQMIGRLIEFGELENNIQAMVNISWGLSRLNYENKFFWLNVESSFMKNIHKLNNMNFRLALTVIAEARVGTQNYYEFMRNEFLSRLEKDSNQIQNQDFVRLYRAFSTLRQKDVLLQQQTEKYTQMTEHFIQSRTKPENQKNQKNSFTLDELAQLTMSLGQQGNQNKSLSDAILINCIEKFKLIQNLHKLNFEQLNNLIIINYSTAIMNSYSEFLLNLMLKNLQNDTKFLIKHKYIIMISQIIKGQRIEASELNIDSKIADEILERIKNDELKFIKDKQQNEINKQIGSEREFQEGDNYRPFDISDALLQLGFNFEREVITEMSNIDFLIKDINLETIEKSLQNQNQQIQCQNNNNNNENNEFQNDKISQKNDQNDKISQINDQNDKISQKNEDNQNLKTIQQQSTLLVEIHGHSHFQTEQNFRGGSLFKERIIKKQGWKYIVITSHQCKQLSKIQNKSEQLTNLLQLFKKAY